MLSSRSLLLSLVLLSYFAVSSVCGAWSQLESDAAPSLVIDASKPLVNVSADLWGIFFEEINHAGVGGLHAERIQNSGFETMLNTYAPWAASASNAAVASVNLSLSQSMPLTWQSPTSLRVDSSATTKATTVGIDNPGFWGISIAGVNAFNVSLFAASTTITSVTVSFTSRDGSMVYGSTTLKGITARWTKLSGIVAVSGHDSAAIFTIQWTTSTRTASIYFDVISCIPVEGWRGLPYIRPDLAEHIAALHPSFVRFPGGCYVEGDSLTDRFNWKKALGPQEERRGHWNLWNYYSEDQLGLFEYLQFIERLTDAYGNPTRTVWVVSSGDSHTSHLRPDQLGPWIDEALDSIEFAVGDASQSEWGRLRAAMGHPQPFHIDYIAIGNEGNFYADQYKANYRVLYAAIHSAYPHIPLIANGYWTDVPIEVYDYHVYQTSSWFFDNQHTFDQYHRNVQIFNSEYAVTTGAGRGNLDAALGEAVWMTGLERNSDLVVLASYAPLLVNDNDQTWNPDAIVFNSSFSYGTPSYWTQLLYSNSYSGLVSGTVQTLTYQLSNTNNISVAVSVGQMSAEECSKQDMAASGSAYVHKIINYAATSQNITIRLDNLPSGSTLKPALEVTILTTAGDSNMDENTFLQPMLVAPVRMSVVVDGPQFTLSLPRWSIAVARAYVSARVQQHVSATLLS